MSKWKRMCEIVLVFSSLYLVFKEIAVLFLSPKGVVWDLLKMLFYPAGLLGWVTQLYDQPYYIQLPALHQCSSLSPGTALGRSHAGDKNVPVWGWLAGWRGDMIASYLHWLCRAGCGPVSLRGMCSSKPCRMFVLTSAGTSRDQAQSHEGLIASWGKFFNMQIREKELFFVLKKNRC